jgi:CheY-like chemotaxis protein
MARILVVDDYPAILGMLQLSLVAEGYEVLIAEGGAAGLRLAGRLKPDLVLLDVDMPEMDGITVCGGLKRDPATSHIPVLLMTGRPSAGMPAKARDAGAAGVLFKPFVRTRLLEEIAQALSEDRSERKPGGAIKIAGNSQAGFA